MTIPNSVTSIGDEAFDGCSGLTSVVFLGAPKIDAGAFRENHRIRDVYCLAKTVSTQVSDEAFEDNTYVVAVLHVLANMEKQYSQTKGWDRFFNCKGDAASLFATMVTSVSISVSSVEMQAGSTRQLSVTVKPDDATDKTVTWTSSNESVATVSSTGVVTAKSVGTAVITCKANDGSGVSATCSVTVVDAPQNVQISISPAGYATFYSSTSAYKLPRQLSAQVVCDCNDGKLQYKTIADGANGDVIPCGTAVVLVNVDKCAGTYSLVAEKSGSVYTDVNYLCGSDQATTTSASGNNYFYKLTYGDGAQSKVFGWYWGASSGAPFRIDAHKAWLALPKSIATRAAYGLADEDVTGIAETAVENEAVYYDLQGRRIVKPTVGGIYIVNGNKVLIKK